MKGNIVLRAGEPNDANRDYLPEAIKGSDMVVNENGNNSQVYPERLREYQQDITGDGLEDTWYEYVPETYDPQMKTPLVFSMHGGLMTGWGQCIYTSWSLVADREGFICVFPTAHERRLWMIECPPEKIDEITAPIPGVPALSRPLAHVKDFHDVRMVLALLEHLKEKYNIDEERVYIQGMSMGDAMTSQTVRYCGKPFAGAAGSGCPTNCKLLFDKDGRVINESGPLDIWQSRLEHDKTPYHYDADDRSVVIGNIAYWRNVNEAAGLPQIKILGEKNLIFYQGKKANVTVMDVRNRDHGQTFDDAQMVWDYMFSGARKGKDGAILHTETVKPTCGDATAVAVARDCSMAWVNGQTVQMNGPCILWDKLKYHGLNGDAIVRGSYLCVPVSFLAKAFGGEIVSHENGRRVILTMRNGTVLQFAEGIIGCVVDNTVESMLCEPIVRDGELYISIEWFCRFVCGLQVSQFDGVLYATDHYAEISRYTAWILQDILTGNGMLPVQTLGG